MRICFQVGGKALGALDWEKPPAAPDRDIGAGDFLEGVLQPAHGALVPLAGSGLGQAQFDRDLGLRETLDRHADHQQGVIAEQPPNDAVQSRIVEAARLAGADGAERYPSKKVAIGSSGGHPDLWSFSDGSTIHREVALLAMASRSPRLADQGELRPSTDLCK